MAFLFRKYTKDLPPDDVSRDDASFVDSEEARPYVPPEVRLFPPSPKVQIILIGLAFFIFNLVLLAIWAMVLSRQVF